TGTGVPVPARPMLPPPIYNFRPPAPSLLCTAPAGPSANGLLQHVAVDCTIDQRGPIVVDARLEGRRTFGSHRRGRRAREQIALARSVIGRRFDRGDVAVVRPVALFERRPRIARRLVGPVNRER